MGSTSAHKHLLQKALLDIWSYGRSTQKRGKVSSTDPLWIGRDILDSRLGNHVGGRALSSLIDQLRGRLQLIRNAESTRLRLGPELTLFLTQCVPQVLSLQPVAQWGCALSYELTAEDPANKLTDGEGAPALLESRLRAEAPSPADCFCVAWHILVESWRHINGVRDPRLPSSLVELAGQIDHPAVRIATAIRALSFQEEVPQTILSDLRQDPDCARIMQKCGWVPRSNGAKV